MFIKELIIQSNTSVIRHIKFSTGLNLIIDNTSSTDSKATGNNIGKTTVLKLIDFCLGANPSIIYTDTENKTDTYSLVKDFLVNNEVLITLILVDNLTTDNCKQIKIQRNFLSRKKAIHKINDQDFSSKDFKQALDQMILNNKTTKPSFRQIISHNIRYTDSSISNTLKTLDKYSNDSDYEILYLYLLGCSFDDGAKKQALLTKLQKEQIFQERLENKQTKNKYEIALSILEDEITLLNQKKESFNLNENLMQDLENLNLIRYEINKTSSLIAKLEIRKNLIEDSQKELNSNISYIDMQQLKNLYKITKYNITNMQKKFEDLVAYHNKMIIEKIRFIAKDLPNLKTEINNANAKLQTLLLQEKELSQKISRGNSFAELEELIAALNEKYQKKGEYESIISQLNEVEQNIKNLNTEIKNIDNYLFSSEFEHALKEQIKKFNKYFSAISYELYGEHYALAYDKKIDKNRQQHYKFNAFNTNMSSGKKQGEILCFDLAYILFADDEGISCLHFLLNDKKELMHDNQLIKVADFVKQNNIQLVISILKDKLPNYVLDKAHKVIELSQNDKLLKIENT